MTRPADRRVTALARLTAALVAMLLMLLGTAIPAQAHATLESSSPADGASLTAPPAKVVLTFDEPVGSEANALTVTTADGVRRDAGDAAVLGPKLSASIKRGAPGGTWTVEWRVVSADGHPVSGALHFTVTGRPAPTATAAPNAAGGSGPGTATVAGIVIVAVLILAGLGVVLVRRGRAGDDGE